ncbi:MAG: TldD/PmbA family protein [Rickettsiaceae bacterium H1]|nr:TldD/PmbA family protein [Rickettsiaceae bacterium H1]
MNSLDVLEKLMKIAKNKGVNADAMITQTKRNCVSYRMNRLENIETSYEENLCLRVITGKKCSSISTNQNSKLENLFEQALKAAKASPEDPHISLPKNTLKDDFNLNSLSIFDSNSLSQKNLIENAKLIEEAALSHGKINNSEGAYSEFSTNTISFANTNNFISSYRKSGFYNSISVIAKDGNSMEQGNDYSFTHNLKDLKKPHEIGNKAAERAIKKLHPKKVKTCKLPVVFDVQIAGSLLQGFAKAVNGEEVSNEASFLKKKMKKQIFNKGVTIIDNPTMKSGVCSYPFDDEGVIGKELLLVKDGKLNNWLLDNHSANKLNLNSTGHANRSKNGKIKPSHSNLYMKPGKFSPEYIISQIKKGILVTDIFGFGTNTITGDYSHGASGFWIEDGEVSTPINEFTIASNMKEMFLNLLPANDLQFNRLINSPTLVVAEMTIAGK